MADYTKPLPVITQDSEPYWSAAKAHEFRMQRCTDCGKFRFPPTHACWYCLSTNTEWAELSGRGTVWSFTVMHQPYYKGFTDELPYAVLVVELEEGPRLMANLVDIDEERTGLTCDMPLEIVFDDVTPEVTLPRFRPIR